MNATGQTERETQHEVNTELVRTARTGRGAATEAEIAAISVRRLRVRVVRMHRARQLLFLFAVACVGAPLLWARPSAPTQEASAAASTPDLSIQRELIDESNAAREAGDYDTARAMVLEVVTYLLARPAAEQDSTWRALLSSAGKSAWNTRDFPTAKTAWQRLYDVCSRTLPDDHPDLQAVRMALGVTLSALGDLPGGRALQEKVLEVRSRVLPDDHPELQLTRLNLAANLFELGDLAGAHALYKKVLDVDLRTLPDDHPDLQSARQGLANTLAQLGDLAGARALMEKVLEVNSRTLPDDHFNLQLARRNLAATMYFLGDLQGARVLQEKVLEVQSRTLPDDHPELQWARMNLAATVESLGDLAGARALLEKVLEVQSRTLSDEHPRLQFVRQNLAATLIKLGDMAGARALYEKAFEVQSRTLPDDHPNLQSARRGLAETIAGQVARANRTPEGEGEDLEGREWRRARCADLVRAVCRAQVHVARGAILTTPGREAEERCSRLAKELDLSLSVAQGFGVFEPVRSLEAESFVLAETMRGAAVVSAELTRGAANAPKYRELRAALSEASDELAGLAQKGTTSEEFDRARAKRESVERELVELARELSGGTESGVELDVESLAGRLAHREAAVGFLRFEKIEMGVVDERDSTGEPALRATSVASLCAFVVHSSNAAEKPDSAQSPTLTLVDLGPIEPIERVARAWREGLGVAEGSRGIAAGAHESSAPSVHALGVQLRELIFDPLRPVLAGTERVVVALDDVLHLVPLDALPLDEQTLVGDRWRIETRTTLTELFQKTRPVNELGQLVAFGDVEYGGGTNSDEGGTPTRLAAAGLEPRASADAGILRGGAWSGGFAALPATGVEARGIARCFADQFKSSAAPELCEHSSATRERLQALAPKARWLHIATHGWFAPESVKSWRDPEPLDKYTGLGSRASGDDQVKRMSPMLLCGLAFAGSNLPENAVGRVPGLVTADELSTLDLSNCDLVVLSACDTNVGINRAGQGVASLQKALQMAGARSVITSLWKVPDEATKELMLDFYRRLWKEKKPKSQALWEAKTKLREAKDERGAPKYTTRDWAAWVLTGDPN